MLFVIEFDKEEKTKKVGERWRMTTCVWALMRAWGQRCDPAHVCVSVYVTGQIQSRLRIDLCVWVCVITHVSTDIHTCTSTRTNMLWKHSCSLVLWAPCFLRGYKRGIGVILDMTLDVNLPITCLFGLPQWSPTCGLWVEFGPPNHVIRPVTRIQNNH